MNIYVYSRGDSLYQIHTVDRFGNAWSLDRLLPLEHAIKYIASIDGSIAPACRMTYVNMVYTLMHRSLERALKS